MNWLDVVLAVLFAVGLAGGYLQGLIRQALSLGAIVCGLILATYLHVPLAAWLAFTFPGLGEATRETAAFLFAAVALISALEAIQRKAMPDTHLLSIGILDRIAGLLVATIAVSFQLSVAVLALRFSTSLHWPVGETMRLVLLDGEKSSVLVPAFFSLLVALVTVVGRLLPEGRPRFLGLM